MFDVGELFLAADDLTAVKRNYRILREQEAKYRGAPHSFEDCLRDTLDTSFQLCQAGLKGDTNPPPEDRDLLQRGIGQLRGHLVNHRFDLSAAKISASRAARLAACVLHDVSDDFQRLRYSEDSLDILRGFRFPDTHRVMGRLKAIPEALFHWSEIATMPTP